MVGKESFETAHRLFLDEVIRALVYNGSRLFRSRRATLREIHSRMTARESERSALLSSQLTTSSVSASR